MLCAFTLDNPSSLTQLQQMRATWGPHYTRPLVLVGNKCDLVAGVGDIHAPAIDLVKSWGAPFVETSAKTQEGVEEAFTLLIHEIQRAQEAMAKEAEAKSSGHKGWHRKTTCHGDVPWPQSLCQEKWTLPQAWVVVPWNETPEQLALWGTGCTRGSWTLLLGAFVW